MEDHKIIEGCILGKDAAFKALVLRYSSILLGVCMRYLRNRNDAEDALQDSFIQIHTSIHTYRNIGSFKSWVIKIAVNVCLKHIRKYKATFDLESVMIEESNDVSIVDEMNAKEILLMLDQLPEAHRLVFNLHVIEGYSHIEIGKILNIPESSSRVYLLRARQR